MIAAAMLALSLLQQVEEASHAEPPIFQVETLLSVAGLLPEKTYGEQRRALIGSALRANAAVRDEASRNTFHVNAAHLLFKQDPAEAARLCREIAGEAATRCWIPIDILEAVRTLSYGEEFRAEASQVLADRDTERAKILVEKWQKKTRPPEAKKQKHAGASAAITKKMDRVDMEGVSDAERSRLLREVLEESDSIADVTDRMMHEGVITAWFAEHREEGTAALAAAKLHKTFAEACRCEDAQCDSIAGRAECSENIDLFAEFLAEKKIDPAVLRIRHPSLAARSLVVKLKEALK